MATDACFCAACDGPGKAGSAPRGRTEECFPLPAGAPGEPRCGAPIAGAPRPRWSVMIPTYNCARYLEATLRSVLTQDPGPEAMQIEVVDDHSTADDPEDVVTRLGGGASPSTASPRTSASSGT